MSDDTAVQRRKWFQSFPEGSIEFMLVTRVLALLLLLALAIVQDVQRPVVVLALTMVLWADYVLMMWWAVQMTTDLDDLFADPPPPADAARRRRVWAACLGASPSVAAALLLVPWPYLLLPSEWSRAAVVHVAAPLLGIAFVALMFVAQAALQRVRLGPRPWTLLLLVPIAHWFAMHRLLTGLHARVHQRREERGQTVKDDSGPGAAVRIADITWVLSILPWGTLVLVSLLRGGWPTGSGASGASVCGAFIAAVFAVADVAAMEQLQRRFVLLLHKHQP